MEQSDWNYMAHIERMETSHLRDLMNTYGQDVWNLAYLLTSKYDLADDIAQDVFLKAYSNIASFRGGSSMKTWLLAITRNTSINYLRTAFLRRVTLMDRVQPKGTSPSAEQEAIDRTLASAIWQDVLKLPVKQREILILHGKYGMTTNEIAAMLQLSEGTVKSRLSRARSRMSLYRKESGSYE
ncbi:RNA polymerase sigma factor [Paenibacillus nasutitermitis]|uniref:RNA polymerase sigma factor n=1 Tax=Paenibacillus nasutitermitis TaxID=1652958 RepID=A0A917DNA3_9BACL|nr:RNA polymerase sigma factor [Paenibacillus nasutitermitis]GGD54036.1 RNA polymerase sigma factor [Paenibacillus nasutitermitis]